MLQQNCINGKKVKAPLRLMQWLLNPVVACPFGDFVVKIDDVQMIGDATAIAGTLGIGLEIEQPVLFGLEYTWSVQ